jgi:TRAP-type C4-dicarboxylate transport system permease small subunit
MNFLETAKKYIFQISRATGVLSYIGFLGMILLTVCDVVLRYAFNRPIVGAYEITQYMLLISVFASFAYCQMLRGHIQISMVVRILPKRVAFIIFTLTSLMTTAIMFFIGYAAAQQAIYAAAKGFTSDVLRFPTSPFIWIEFVCMLIFSLACLVDVLYSAVAIFDKDLQDKLVKEWQF